MRANERRQRAILEPPVVANTVPILVVVLSFTMKTPVIDRFIPKIQVDWNTSCWEWTASRNNKGYGVLGTSGTKIVLAHRFSYEHYIGPIPKGLELDHLCRNIRCVNPHHLEPVTHRTNLLRGKGIAAVNASRTHCPKGHEYTPQNTYTYDGFRECRSCALVRMRNYKRNRKLSS